MSEPMDLGDKKSLEDRNQSINIKQIINKKNKILVFAVLLTLVGSVVKVWDCQPTFYAHAYTEDTKRSTEETLRFSSLNSEFFGMKEIVSNGTNNISTKNDDVLFSAADEFAKKLYSIVGDAPIKEMVPFIAKRNERTAAFLVAIAKKESSFGEHAPSLNGQDCYNYWGYKGAGSRGTSMGYGCFASADEAIKIVGDRIDNLVDKKRNTPQNMVHTWKCGTSCAGDAGAPSWVATVALYFNKIVS